jgi:hypothetical protein
MRSVGLILSRTSERRSRRTAGMGLALIGCLMLRDEWLSCASRRPCYGIGACDLVCCGGARRHFRAE